MADHLDTSLSAVDTLDKVMPSLRLQAVFKLIEKGPEKLLRILLERDVHRFTVVVLERLTELIGGEVWAIRKF